MKRNNIILTMLVLVAFFGCTEQYEEHYAYPERVDKNLWDAMQDNDSISDFVQILADFRYDTLFDSDFAYTVFIPSNEAMQEYVSTKEVDTTLIGYHFSPHLIQSGNIEGTREVRMLSRKFAFFRRYGNEMSIDGINISYESSLYNNGKFYIVDQVVEPKLNLYEFFTKNNEILKLYVDSQDSIVLDKERSKPIDYDSLGRTVFDSVTFTINIFEEDYFPVSEEFRRRTATVVFPLKEDYENALTAMAQELGGDFIDYNDIPLDWQQEELVPYLLERGVFTNLREPEDFYNPSPIKPLKMRNIAGDSVVVTYQPGEKTVCSNGYAYNYADFQVPDSMYKVPVRYEMESLVVPTGGVGYAWSTDSIVDDGGQNFGVTMSYFETASEDSVIGVFFDGYEGEFSVRFKTKKALFPRRYVMAVHTRMQIGGIYDVYVNDELLRTFDYDDFKLFKYNIFQSVTGDFYRADASKSFCSFDMYVDIEELGKPEIRFEYQGPGDVSSNGFVMDYIEFTPVSN